VRRRARSATPSPVASQQDADASGRCANDRCRIRAVPLANVAPAARRTGSLTARSVRRPGDDGAARARTPTPP
jgi:hypothetical protein